MNSTAMNSAAAAPVLVAEDDHDMRALVAFALRRAGFTVVTAHDGSSAVEKLANTKFGLALLDINMPGENGFAVCEHIRRNSQMPVIMISARDSDRDIVQAFDIGADDYVTKPFSQSALVARVRSLLRRTAEARAPDIDAETILSSFSADQPDLDPPTPSPPLDRASAHAHDYATAGGTLTRFRPRRTPAPGARR
jgi:DNA-binding response OmpR family regulator